MNVKWILSRNASGTSAGADIPATKGRLSRATPEPSLQFITLNKYPELTSLVNAVNHNGCVLSSRIYARRKRLYQSRFMNGFSPMTKKMAETAMVGGTVTRTIMIMFPQMGRLSR
jgi:hypothetical protein